MDSHYNYIYWVYPEPLKFHEFLMFYVRRSNKIWGKGIQWELTYIGFQSILMDTGEITFCINLGLLGLKVHFCTSFL
jgi:hypothetical protein